MSARRVARLASAIGCLLLLLPAVCQAQDDRSAASIAAQPPLRATVTQTIFNHPDSTWWYLAGQINVISQMHPRFTAPYTGPNSLRPAGEAATSHVATLYAGAQLGRNTELVLNVESAGGSGLSGAAGVAGFPNYDVVRTPSLSQKPYVARLMFHRVIPLAREVEDAERGPLGILPALPVRRLEIRAGKLSTADFFDTNGPGGDSRFQFMNWTVDNSGSYDWAGDTRGYTFSVVIEYVERGWTLRFSEALMPKVANGIDLEWNLRRARGDNLELELRPKLLAGRRSVVRLLAYRNRADMGSYSEAIDAFLAGDDPVPDIVVHRRQGRVKYGFGANVEQELGHGVRVFGRAGWNDGRTESFVFTEVDRSVLAGFDVSGSAWGRTSDRFGAAFSMNALSAPHRDYLALGGLGFLLGDGRLTYSRERILETYYTLPLVRGVYVAGDLQYVVNPGYNRDRGPVLVASARLHLGF